MYGVEGESVSFGQFASETLSWEKWSTFNRNRYVEEAEKFSKPGSVKQKKAFLEAHFNRMTALSHKDQHCVEIADSGAAQNQDKADLPAAELIKPDEPALKKRSPLSSYIPSVEGTSSSTPPNSGIQSPAVHPVKETDKQSCTDGHNKSSSSSFYKIICRKLGRFVSRPSKNSPLKTSSNKEKSKERLCQLFLCGSKLHSKSFQGARETESFNI